MAMTCDACDGRLEEQSFWVMSGHGLAVLDPKVFSYCGRCAAMMRNQIRRDRGPDKEPPAVFRNPEAAHLPVAAGLKELPEQDGDTIRWMTIQSERIRAERAKYSRGQYVPDEVPPETWGETMEQKIAAAVQKALAAALPTFPSAPLPTSAAPDKAAAILAEDADVDFAARRDALDFDLEAARAVELLPTEPDGRPRVPDANKLAVVDLCRNRLAACKAEAELETIRKFAAQRGLLAAGAELGFKPPEPGAATDAERQKRQREFEMATAPRPGTAVREGPQRPVLSAWGSSVDPRVLNEGG
ncbi:MAG: hypothetical protein E6Q97_11100 [Desulfurellales bacterium]|nr:MAG: hypothetical protein E6Q97_11100 [Desulfurellales bacterium]